MLVLSALYKAESLLSLGDTPPNVIHDLLTKCDAYVEKYSMQEDTDITDSIRAKKKALLQYQAANCSGINSYSQLEEVRKKPAASPASRGISPKNIHAVPAKADVGHFVPKTRENSVPKKNFVVKSKRGVSTDARLVDHSYGSNHKHVAPADLPKPGRKSPGPLVVRRASRDLGQTPNSRKSYDKREEEKSFARKRNGPRLTHTEGYDDGELSYATMRQSHGAEGGRGNFFKPKLKNQPSRIDTDGSEQVGIHNDFLEDSERFEPEPEPETEKQPTLASPSFATKSTRPKSSVKVQSSEAKKGFKEGLDGLLKLGDYLKSQIEKEMEDDERRKRKKNLGQKIFDDSLSGPEKSSIDKEISGKMNELLTSVAEWEKQRVVFQERFQKLERAIEKQTVQPVQKVQVQDEHRSHVSNQNIQTPKQGPYAKRPTEDNSANLLPKASVRVTGELQRSQDPSASRNSLKMDQLSELAPRKSLRGPATPLSAVAGSPPKNSPKDAMTPNGIPILSKNASAARSLMSVNSSAYKVTELEDFTSPLEDCLKALEKGETPEREVLHNLDQHYLIVFQVKKSVDPQSKKTVGSVALKLLKDNELLGEELLSTDDLRYLFQQVNLIDTLSYRLPVTAFTDITCFIEHCLVKFVHLSEVLEGSVSPEVLKFPKSLIDDVIWTNFLGEDCTYFPPQTPISTPKLNTQTLAQLA